MHRNEGGMGRRKYNRLWWEFVLELMKVDRVIIIDLLNNTLNGQKTCI